MQNTIVWLVVLGVILLVGIGMIYALRVPRVAPKTYPADKGPNFIDVSSYSPKMQGSYELFTRKCSRCHTVARPINSTFTSEEWREYVYKMMRKPGSGLTPKTADEIIEFLTYDSQHREENNRMITATMESQMPHTLKFLIFTALFCVIGLQIGDAQEDDMKRVDFQISIDAQPVVFTAPPIVKDGVWLVPLESFAERLGIKSGIPTRRKDGGSLSRNGIGTLCTPPISG